MSQSQANVLGAGKRGSQRAFSSSAQINPMQLESMRGDKEAVPTTGILKRVDMELKIMSSVVFWYMHAHNCGKSLFSHEPSAEGCPRRHVSVTRQATLDRERRIVTLTESELILSKETEPNLVRTRAHPSDCRASVSLLQLENLASVIMIIASLAARDIASPAAVDCREPTPLC